MNLYLPASQKPIEATGSLTVRNAKRWLESLPIVNMGETTRQFYQELQAFNRSDIPGKQRFDTMGKLLPTSMLVVQHLNKHFANNAFPLARKTKQMQRLATAFYQEMSVGYKIIINDVSNDALKIDKQSLAVSLHHAIHQLYQIMLLNAQTYTSMPGKVWHDIHQMYEFADKKGVCDTQVTSLLSEDGPDKNTITDVYLKCCLLGLSEPYALRNGEALKMDRFLDKVVGLCTITKVLNADEHGVLHVIGLKSAGPPVHVNLAELTTFSNLRGLEIKKLLQYLERTILDNPDELEPISEVAARRLLEVWNNKEQRKFSRVEANERLIAAIGINDILHAIRSDKYPTMDGEQIIKKLTEDEAAKTTPGISLSTTQFNIKPKNDTWYKTTITDPRYPDSWHYWRLINTSAGGYGLLWEANSASRAQVGDVIALRENENGRFQWRMGQIVRLRHNEKEQLIAGVKMLAPRTVIATVEDIESQATRFESPFEIIMLPGMKTFKQPPSILAAKNSFKVGDRLIVSMLGKQLTVKLKTIGDSQTFFSQYYYQSSQLMDKPDEKVEFETLWQKQE